MAGDRNRNIARDGGLLVGVLFAWAAFASGSTGARAEEGRAGPQGGSLVICGGGGMPDRVRARFVELAGGANARILVVPTASESADDPGPGLDEFLAPWRPFGPASVSLLHTRSRREADDPAFAAPVDEATAIWFSGGDQSRITDAYLGTAVEAAFRRLLDRGGVIGGTSAGAAVMSRVMITGGAEKATVGTGLGYLPGAVVDQHALRRSRLNRLLGVLAEHPDLAGVAVDESTALIVDLKARTWQVSGESYVVVCRTGGAVGAPVRIDVFHDREHGDLSTWRAPDRVIESDR